MTAVEPDVSPFPDPHGETGNETAFPVPAGPVSETGNAVRNLYFDVAGMLDGDLPDAPAPVLLRRSDGHAIFYDGFVNVVFGDPESGKTWIALAACAEALMDGRRCIVLDLDHNGPNAIVHRLLTLGVGEDVLRNPDRFRYVEPEDAGHLLAVVADLVRWRPAVAVVDSIGELVPLFGASSNSPDDFTQVHSRTLKPLATAGAAVICIDHLAKNAESRSQGATGTIAKRRTLRGASVRVKVIEPFTPGEGGRALLTVNKDANGGLRANCPTGDKEPVAGTFTMTVRQGVTFWSVRAPDLGQRNPDEAADPADVEALRQLDPPPANVKDARERMNWRTERAMVAMREFRALPVTDTQGPVTGNGASA